MQSLASLIYSLPKDYKITVPTVLLKYLIESSKKGNKDIQYTLQLLEIITNDSEMTKHAIQLGIVARIIALFNESMENIDTLRLSLLIIGNVAMEGGEYKEQLFSQHVCDSLYKAYLLNSLLLNPLVAWVISELLREVHYELDTLQPLCVIIEDFIFREDDEVLEYTVKALSTLCICKPYEGIARFTVNKMMGRITQCIHNANLQISGAAIRFIGSLSANTNAIILKIVEECNSITTILNLLVISDKDSILQQCVWALSNIMGHGSEAVCLFISINAYECIVTLLRKCSVKLRSEILLLLHNVINSSNISQISYFADVGIIGLLSEQLRIEENEKEVLNILVMLHEILKTRLNTHGENKYFMEFMYHNGIITLNKLLTNKCIDLARMAEYLLTLYYKYGALND